MIALNKEMPQECFECPCLGTYSIEDDNGELHLLRQCHACDKLIYHATFSDYKKDKIIQQKWTDLPRPKWCPWQEKDITEHDDEYSWHHSMAGFGGDY